MPNRVRPPRLDAHALLAYDRTVFNAFVRRLRRLPRRVTHLDLGIAHGSMIRTLDHILNVHESWLLYIVPGRQREIAALWRETGRQPTTWKGLDRYAARVWDGIDARGPTLTERELDRVVKAPWMPGRYTVRDALLQASFEEAHHIGEIIGALWRFDLEPPPMTWIERRPRPKRLAPGGRGS
jgi:uncharacterized damage-inducible protein DinB